MEREERGKEERGGGREREGREGRERGLCSSNISLKKTPGMMKLGLNEEEENGRP